MAKITREEFHKILMKPQKECDGYDLHIRHLWIQKDYNRLFESTGIFFEDYKNLGDYRSFVELVQSIQDKEPEQRRMVITFHSKEGWDAFHKAMEEEVERRYGKSKIK
jgi:hypothetical protein